MWRVMNGRRRAAVLIILGIFFVFCAFGEEMENAAVTTETETKEEIREPENTEPYDESGQGMVFIFPVQDNSVESGTADSAEDEAVQSAESVPEPDSRGETGQPGETAGDTDAGTEETGGGDECEAENPIPETAAEEESRGIADGNESDGETDRTAPEEVSEGTSPEPSGEEETGQDDEALLSGTAGTESGGSSQDGTEADGEISSLEVARTAANDRYSSLTFSFSSGGKEYACLVTGIGETAENGPESYRKLAGAIVRSFLSGEVFTLSDRTAKEEFGLSLKLIDAEKTDLSSGGDTNICWAASAADMLEYAGWNVSAGESGETDEDAAFREFGEEFSNLGGYQAAGISWYLDGVNPEQYTYKKSGEIAYGQDLDHGASQQLNEGSGGYWKEYAAAEAAQEYTDQLNEQIENAADRLEEGYAVGLGVYFYQDQSTLSSGHAVTVFGYVREKLEQAASAIRALFLSDSDDRARAEASAPEDRPNDYVMYPTAPFENGDLSTLRLEHYGQSPRTAAVGRVTTLVPRNAAGTEREGTGDAVTSPNLTPTGLRVQDEDGVSAAQAKTGSTVTVESEFSNLSYRPLPAGAQIRYQVSIFRDGAPADQVIQTLNTDGSAGMRPNSSVTGSFQTALEKEGEYTFETRVLGITSADGKDIAEAYVNDNLYRGAAVRLTVQADESRPAEPETSAGEGAGSGKKPETEAERIYVLTVVLATDTEYALDFDASAASPESFLRLRNRKTGETADPECYQIARREEGGFTISFREDFIRSLRPGDNDFALSWYSGRVLIRITIL